MINGKAHFGVVRGKNRQVKVSPKGLACGVYPIVINDVPNTRAIRAVMRIWVITGPKHILRIGFPLPEPPLGLS